MKEAASSSTWFKCGGLVSTMKDRACLLDGEWLDDIVVHKMQLLICRDYPHVAQPYTSLLQNRFRYPKQNTIQIMHVDNNHWVLVSNIGSPSAWKFLMYDTLESHISEQRRNMVRVTVLPRLDPGTSPGAHAYECCQT